MDMISPFLNGKPFHIGDDFPYATYAEALADATLVAEANPVFVVHKNLVEDIALPQGASLVGLSQSGSPIYLITGQIAATAGTGIANVVSLKLIGDGAKANIGSTGSFSLYFHDCEFVSTDDYALVATNHPVTHKYYQCVVTSTSATAPAFDLNYGSHEFFNVSCTDYPTSGTFALITSGTLIDHNSVILGAITTTNASTANFNLYGTVMLVATGPVIIHDSSRVPGLYNVYLYSASGNIIEGGENVLNAGICKTGAAQAVESTIGFSPVTTIPQPFYPDAYAVSAAETLDLGKYRKIRIVSSGGAVTSTAVPFIDTSVLHDSELVYLEGTSNVNYITIQDNSVCAGSKLLLKDAADFHLKLHDGILFLYNKADDLLIEQFGHPDMHGRQGTDVASANNLALPTDGDSFEVTGATEIQLISNIGLRNGSTVTLFFASNPTIKHATATSGTNITILLAGSSDAAMTAGSNISFKLSEIGGTQAWRETGRSFV